MNKKPTLKDILHVIKTYDLCFEDTLSIFVGLEQDYYYSILEVYIIAIALDFIYDIGLEHNEMKEK